MLSKVRLFIYSFSLFFLLGNTLFAGRYCADGFNNFFQPGNASKTTMYFLPGSLRDSAKKQGKTLARALIDQVDNMAHDNLANENILIGPFAPQVSRKVWLKDRWSDHTAFYNVAQLHNETEMAVDPLIGTPQQVHELFTKLKSKKINVMVDYVVNQVGYLGKTADEQKHYLKLLKQNEIALPDSKQMEKYVKRVEQSDFKFFESTQTLQEKFLFTHVYFPKFGWVARTDKKFFYQGNINPKAFDIFDNFDPSNMHNKEITLEDFKWATNEIQTKELSGLPKLNLENAELLAYLLEPLKPMAKAGVTGFRIDAARHMKPEILVKVIKEMVKETKLHNPEKSPQIFLEYWTTSLLRLKEAMEILENALGDDYQYVKFFDYRFPIFHRAVVWEGQSLKIFNDFYLNVRKDSGVKLDKLIPVIIDHDSNRPFYNGSHHSITQTVSGFAMGMFTHNNKPLIYNAFADPQFSIYKNPVTSDFPRYQMEHVFETESNIYKITQSLFKELSKFNHLQTEGAATVKSLSDNELIMEKKLSDGSRLFLRMTRWGDRFNRVDNIYGKRLWSYLSEFNFEESGKPGFGVEIFHLPANRTTKLNEGVQ